MWWSLLFIVIVCSSMSWPVLPIDKIHVGYGSYVGISLHYSSLVFGQDSLPSTISSFYIIGGMLETLSQLLAGTAPPSRRRAECP